MSPNEVPVGMALELLTESDLQSVLDFQEEIFSSIENSTWLRRNESSMLHDCLIHHVVLGVREDGRLRGLGILVDAGSDSENLQYYLDPAPGLIAVSCNLKLVLVAADTRGLGLGAVVVRHLEDEAVARGRRRILCTIHPANTASQRLFSKLGYVQQAQVTTKYGLRDVLLHDVDRSSF